MGEEQEPLLIGNEALIHSLKSQVQSERELVLISLSNLPESTEKEILLKSIDQNVLKILVELLKDNQAVVVQLNLRAISNLIGIDCFWSDQKDQKLNIIETLLGFGLLESLLDLIKQLCDNLNRVTINEIQRSESSALIEESFDFIQNIIQVFDDKQIKYVTESPVGQQILDIVYHFLQSNVQYGRKQVLGIFSVLTEFHTSVNKTICSDRTILERLLHNLGNNQVGTTIQSLSCQILYNLLSEDTANLDLHQLYAEQLVAYLLSTLGIRIFEELKNLKQIKQHNSKPEDENEAEEAEEHHHENDQEEPNLEAIKPTELEKNVEECFRIWMESAENIQSLLGLLINLLEDKSGDDVVEEEYVDSDCEDLEEEEKENGGNEGSKNPDSGVSSLSENPFKQTLVSLILNEGLLQILLEKQSLLDPQTQHFFNDLGGESAQIFTQCSQINEFSLSALTNLTINHLPKILGNTPQKLIEYTSLIWNQLTQYCTATLTPEFQEIYDSPTINKSLLLKLKLFLLSLKQIPLEQVKSIPAADILALAQSFNATTTDEEVYLVYFDLVALRFHAKNFIPREEIALVTDYLLQQLLSENPMISAQVLNVFFEIYSEENYDDVFVSKQLIQVLRSGRDLLQQRMPQLKQMLQKQQYEFIKETQLNLKRFIKYKEKHIPGLN